MSRQPLNLVLFAALVTARSWFMYQTTNVMIYLEMLYEGYIFIAFQSFFSFFFFFCVSFYLLRVVCITGVIRFS